MNLRLAIASCLLALGFGPPAHAAVKVGDPFPALGEAGLSGPTLPATTGKVTLIDFCASWCAPCKASFPAYDRIEADFAPKGVVLLAVSIDQSASAYAGFVRKLHPTFPVVNDLRQKLVGQVEVPSMPTSYLLDRSGKVRFIHPGYHSGSTEKELRQELQTLLAEPAPSS